MKTKLETLLRKEAEIQAEIDKVSFERKDTSYRRSGGYFGTEHADTSDVIIVSYFARTKHLNTYICVDQSEAELANQLETAKINLQIERDRLQRIQAKKWAKDSIGVCVKFTDQQIKNETILTNYVKFFVEGNKHIYAAHPFYKHSDYNKWRAMPNTPKHRKIATQLNRLMESNIKNLNAKYNQI